MFKSLSTSLILRGILAVAVGIMALAWPQVTVLALVILFAVYAFIAAGLEATQAFSSRKAGPVFGHLLLGLVDLAAGVVALAWPGPTAGCCWCCPDSIAMLCRIWSRRLAPAMSSVDFCTSSIRPSTLLLASSAPPSALA